MAHQVLRNGEDLMTNVDNHTEAVLVANLDPLLRKPIHSEPLISVYLLTLRNRKEHRLARRSANKHSVYVVLDQMLGGRLHHIQIEGQIVLHRTVHSAAQAFEGKRTGIVRSLHSKLDRSTGDKPYRSGIRKFSFHGLQVFFNDRMIQTNRLYFTPSDHKENKNRYATGNRTTLLQSSAFDDFEGTTMHIRRNKAPEHL